MHIDTDANLFFFLTCGNIFKIREIDSKFDLVMISELMDESLVLLAELLCLPLYAVANLRKNARKKEVKVLVLLKSTQV